MPCKPTLARPGTRDEYSACVSKELVADDAYDFLLFSLPDNDHHSHRWGPDATPVSIAHADRCFGELVEACGGMDQFLDTHSVILVADHAQTRVEHPLALAESLADEWRVVDPNTPADGADLAVSPISRAAGIYVLADGARAARVQDGVLERLRRLDGVDLFAWLSNGDGTPVHRPESGPPACGEVVVERQGSTLRFRPGRGVVDRRGRGWEVDGDLDALLARVDDGRIESEDYPDALSRLWSALRAPHAGDILVSAAAGFELVDWGGVTHCPGGSHGSLHAGDSLGPLLLCGLEPGIAASREQWALRDVARLVLDHFDVGGGSDPMPERDASMRA